MKRWVCPTCGSGVNAPAAPRKNDVRRYCLDCSKTAGILVERSAPALERKRMAAKTATAERQRTKAQVAAAKYVIHTVDAAGQGHEVNVKAELKRALTTMGYFKDWYGKTPTMDDLTIGVRRRTDARSSGRAYLAGFEVTFTFGTSHEQALELIYHEAAHMATPRGEQPHGKAYRRILADALQGRWPFIVYGSVQRGACYGADEHVVAQMREHVKAGGEL